MYKNKLFLLIQTFLLVFLVVLPNSMFSFTSGDYDLSIYVFDSEGGDKKSVSPPYRLTESLGQPMIGEFSSGSFLMQFGFFNRSVAIPPPHHPRTLQQRLLIKK